MEAVKVTGRLYSMKEACEATGMTYENLKFYCNRLNRRVFDEKDIAWIKSLVCLKNCDMTLTEMKEYLDLCLQGQPSIPKRKVMLAKKRELLVEKLAKVQEAIDYIDWKQQFYDNVLSGKEPYVSNLLP